MSRWGIRGLLTAATVGVAVLALAFAAVLTSPLVRSSAERSARESLARDADLLARLPLAERLSERPDAVLTRPVVTRRGIAVGIVAASGEARGAALALSEAERQQALARVVSTSGELSGEPVLLEARPLPNGAAVVLASRRADVDATVDQQRRRLLLALGLGLLVALAAGALVARRLGRPLAGLAATARRLSAGERGVTAEVAPGGPREVAEVAEALRRLDLALAASEERQRRFLMSVSHELRTPLTSIRGYAEALLDGAVTPDEVPGVARTLVGESERMERYVADLLALARLEADDFTLAVGDVDLVRLLTDGQAAWADRVARAGLTLDVEAPPYPVRLRTDAGRVRQVLDVLTDNAVRVCPAGSRVVWSLTARPGGVRLEVRDSGPGLAEADAADAFEPGVLHDRYAGTGPGGEHRGGPGGGHGLGLAIAHGVVTRLGGTIRLGRAPEGGAAFEVELPVG
jgi:two-component system sensor histidine kinase BaeS